MGEADRPVSRSITCAATAGSSASGATPARRGATPRPCPSAAASASASRVDAGSPAIRARRAPRASREPGAARAGRRPRRERGPARARRTDSRPTARGCGARSGARTACRAGRAGAMERADAQRPDRHPLDALRGERPLELERLRPVGDPPGEQHEHVARARASAARTRARSTRTESSHWTSSIAIRSGSRSLSSWSTSRTATASARSIDRLAAASSSSSATSSARRRGGGERRAGRRRGRPRTDRRARRGRGRARPRPVGREDAQTLRARTLDAREPERRLADPGLALEHERGGPSRAPSMNAARRRAPRPCRRSRAPSSSSRS